MLWYDLFSRFYDDSLEKLYVEQRRMAVEALQLAPEHFVLDVPCGTGQSFDELAPRLQSEAGGLLLGVDRSAGMLKRAARRIDMNGWDHVRLLQASALDLANPLDLNQAGRHPDRLLIFLGLSAFEQWELSFAQLWQLLAPGGRCVIVDVHAPQPDFQGRMVNLVAQADIRRTSWLPLEQVATDYERVALPSLKQHGGQLFLASGRKPTPTD